jgi:hypothetical protein
MRYFEHITIVNEDGLDITTATPRELPAEEVIDILRENLAKAERPVPQLIKRSPTANADSADTVFPAVSGRGHSCCGSKGNRHKNGCSRSGRPDLPPPPKEEVAGMLTEKQFTSARSAKENDFRFNAQKLAGEMKVDVREINRALLSQDYAHYKERYESSH